MLPEGCILSGINPDKNPAILKRNLKRVYYTNAGIFPSVLIFNLMKTNSFFFKPVKKSK